MDETENEPQKKGRVSRRAFIRGAGAAGAAAVVSPALLQPPDTAPAGAATVAPGALSGAIELSLTVNGTPHRATVEPRTTLLQALRYHLDTPLTGTKEVCDHGQCGACTVLLDGRAVYACMTLAVDAAGKRITTIEGLARGDELHPIQEAFIEHDALQCGFCTPGFIMAVKALLDRNPAPTVEDVRHACAGNLCRCGSYPRVFEAALDAARKMNPSKG